ncbi:MAG: 3-oxo-tetronate kinase [Pseudomonadota bacterium]
MSVVIGAIADDFTGATDLANTLVKEGLSVVQMIGVPADDAEIGDAQAVVVALKSRTAPVEEAVAQSRAALAWLKARGARTIVSKYCSTFDSTADGNIGPIADALMADLGTDFALVCPAFPENKRTIYKGQLFVGDVLLSESPMRDHPLTPMRDADLMRLMSAQSAHEVGLIPLETVREGADAIRGAVANLISGGKRYGVIDALTDEDLRGIGAAAYDHALITGGSGVAMGLPKALAEQGDLDTSQSPRVPRPQGRALVLAGSCSVATRGQIAAVRELWPSCKFTAQDCADRPDLAAELVSWAESQASDTPVLISASADPEEVALAQKAYGVEKAGAMIESVMSAVACALTEKGFDKLVVAGGETSGAVVSGLGAQALRIGPEIAPGVPWTEILSEKPIALALKSGNFGGQRFFQDAFEVLS